MNDDDKTLEDSFAGIGAPDGPAPDLRAAAATRARVAAAQSSSPCEDPEQIGPYRILERIGEGGMGMVYLAEQREPIRRTVALKVIKPGMDSREVIARFEAERQALAMMSHPNIACIFEAGITDAGRPFFAMEHVAGVPLTRYSDENKLTTRQRLELFILVCQAIQHAHERGIIHRDLKPSNILVTTVDDKPVAKVIDFGIAKAIHQQLTQHTLFTHTGSLIGTPEYMSPEQAQGTGGIAIDLRADIYSLGVILYELLTGTTPFDPRILRSSRPEEMAKLIRDVDPPKPSTRLISSLAVDPAHAPAGGSPAADVAKCRRTDVRSLRREISGDLDWIVLKAIAKEPARRYQSAAALAADLGRFLNGDRVEARSDSYAYKIVRRWRRFSRDRVKVALTAAALLLAIAVTVTTLKLMPDPRPPAGSLAVLPLASEADAGEDAEYLSDLATETLIRSLSKVSSLKVMSRNAVSRFKGVEPQKAGRELHVEAVLSGRVVTRDHHLLVNLELIDGSDGSQTWAGDYERERYDTPAAQAEIAKAVCAALRIRDAQISDRVGSKGTNDLTAFQLYLRGRFFWYKTSEEGYQKAILCFEKAIERDPSYALAYCGLADCYVALGVDYLPPDVAYPKARGYAQKALELAPSLADAHISLGTIDYYYDWNWTEAQRELHLAMAADPKVAETNTCYLHSMDSLGDPEQGLQRVQQALVQNPLSVSLSGEVGCASYYARRFEQTIASSRDTLDLDPGYAIARWNLARSHSQRREFDDALTELGKARDALGSWPGYTAEMAYALARAGQTDKAKALLAELETRATGTYVDPVWFAIIRVGLGENDQALTMLEKAVQIRSSSVPFLSVEPKFDPIRGDPRFEAVLARSGLIK